MLLLSLWAAGPASAQAKPTSTGTRAAPPAAEPVGGPATCTSSAQTTEALLRDGQELLEAGQPGAAAACFEIAERNAARDSQPALEGRAALGIGQALYAQGEFAPIDAAADRAQVLFERIGDRLQAARAKRLKAVAARFRGERERARTLYEAALAEFASLDAKSDRANALLGLQDLEDSEARKLALVDEAVALARAAGDLGTEARALHFRSDKHFGAGRFGAALADLTEAIDRMQRAGDRDALADAYVSLGRLFRAHGQPERAIESYDWAIAIQEERNELRGLVQSLNAKAIALARLDRKDEALRCCERAYEIALRTGSPRLVSFAQGNLAGAYDDTDPRKLTLLKKAIDTEPSPYILAYRHSTISDSYAAIGEPQLALQHLDRAVAFARESENREYLPTVLYSRARIRRRLGHLDDALEDARAAVLAIEDLRTRLVPLDFLKQGFAERHQDVFGLAIALMMDRGEAAQSLVTAEQGRARALLDLLASRALIGAAGAAGGPAKTPIAEVPRKEIALVSYASATPASASEIVEAARRRRCTMLSYWVGEEELFLWAVSPEGEVHGRRVGVKRAELERAVAAATPRLAGTDFAALARLRGWLVDPLAEWLPAEGGSLLVIPHGVLFRVSFAALRDARGRYLLERFALSYAPSASTLAFTERLASRHLAAGFLLVSDPRPTPNVRNGSPLPPLPASAREVSAIRALLGKTGTTVLTGTGATERAVRRALPGKRVVHFATHGVLDADEPADSFLALGREASGTGVGSDPGEPPPDGRLTVAELYGLSLDADLVFLSACRSAAGRLSGDGVFGMSRALFYAGATSVIATLWDVADEPSAGLVVDFYRRSLRGADKRAALRGAQLRLLGSLRAGRYVVRTPRGRVRLTENPFYWAGAILLGEP